MNDKTLTAAVLSTIEDLKRSAGVRRVVTLGNSMGGFMALVMPRLTEVDCAVAISPQYSIHPSFVPEEKRWEFWRNRVSEFVHETIGEMNYASTKSFVFHGDTEEEKIHWSRFPQCATMAHFIVHGAGHDLARDFKDRGLLRRIFRNCTVGRARQVRLILEGHYQVERRDSTAKEVV